MKGQPTKIANHIWKPSSSRLADYGKNQGHFKGGSPIMGEDEAEADSNFLHGSTLCLALKEQRCYSCMYSELRAAIFF